jgi:hypothetical protein
MDWLQYEQQVGFRNDLLFGQLAYISAGNPDLELDDFMPYLVKEIDQEQLARDIRGSLARMRAANQKRHEQGYIVNHGK